MRLLCRLRRSYVQALAACIRRSYVQALAACIRGFLVVSVTVSGFVITLMGVGWESS